MEISETLLMLLEQKKEKFTAYEAATKALLTCEQDSAEHYIIERGALATEIDNLNEEIGRLCDKREDSILAVQVVAAQCNFEHVPQDLQLVYEKAQAVRGVMARIVDMEPLVLQRMDKFQLENKELIRQNHNLPKIKKYLNDLSENPAGTGFITGKA